MDPQRCDVSLQVLPEKSFYNPTTSNRNVVTMLLICIAHRLRSGGSNASRCHFVGVAFEAMAAAADSDLLALCRSVRAAFSILEAQNINMIEWTTLYTQALQ